MIPGNSNLIDRVRVEISSKILAHSRMRSLVSDPLVFLFGVAQLFKLKCSLCGISSWRCSAVKRPKLTVADRFLWAWLAEVWRDWRSTLVIVKPETVIGWHRKGFRLFWTRKVRRGQPGRPSVSPDVQELNCNMSRKNPLWVSAAHSRRATQARHRHR